MRKEPMHVSFAEATREIPRPLYTASTPSDTYSDGPYEGMLSPLALLCDLAQANATDIPADQLLRHKALQRVK